MKGIFVRVLSVGIMVGTSGSSALGDGTSAREILPGCRALQNSARYEEPAEIFMKGYCIGILEGVAAVGTLGANRVICMPDKVTNEQLVDVVVRYIETHPERGHVNFTLTALFAMVLAWPCPHK
jgi:hypothetical protein